MIRFAQPRLAKCKWSTNWNIIAAQWFSLPGKWSKLTIWREALLRAFSYLERFSSYQQSVDFARARIINKFTSIMFII